MRSPCIVTSSPVLTTAVICGLRGRGADSTEETSPSGPSGQHDDLHETHPAAIGSCRLFHGRVEGCDEI